MNVLLDKALANLRQKGEALGLARSEEQRLEDERGLLKELAIQRIVKRDSCAATPAEKIVESDQEYMAHRIAQRGSVVTRFKADAEYWAAKTEATQASLIPPDVMLLFASNDALLAQRDHWQHVATGDHAALVDLRGELRDVKQANADLVQANRELASQIQSELPVRREPFPLPSTDGAAPGVQVPSENAAA